MASDNVHGGSQPGPVVVEPKGRSYGLWLIIIDALGCTGLLYLHGYFERKLDRCDEVLYRLIQGRSEWTINFSAVPFLSDLDFLKGISHTFGKGVCLDQPLTLSNDVIYTFLGISVVAIYWIFGTKGNAWALWMSVIVTVIVSSPAATLMIDNNELRLFIYIVITVLFMTFSAIFIKDEKDEEIAELQAASAEQQKIIEAQPAAIGETRKQQQAAQQAAQPVQTNNKRNR